MKKIFKISLMLANALVLSGTMFGSQDQESLKIASDFSVVTPVDDGAFGKKLLTIGALYEETCRLNGRLIVTKEKENDFFMPLVSYSKVSDDCDFFVARVNQVNEQNIEVFNITQNIKNVISRSGLTIYDIGGRAFKGDQLILSGLGLVNQPTGVAVPVYIPVPFFVPFFTPVPMPVPMPASVRHAGRQQRARLTSRRIIPSIVEIEEEISDDKKALAENMILKAIDDAVMQSEERKSQIERELFKEERRKRKKAQEEKEKIEKFIKSLVLQTANKVIDKLEEAERNKFKTSNVAQEKKVVPVSMMSRQMTSEEIKKQDEQELASAAHKEDDDEVIDIDEADSKQKKNKKKKSKTEEQKAQEDQEELLMQQMQKEIDNTPLVKLPKYLLEICPLIDKSTNEQLNNYIKEIESLVKQQKKLFKKSTEEFDTVILLADSMILLCKIVMNINQLRLNNSEIVSDNSCKKLVIFEDNDFLIKLLSTFSAINIEHEKVLENKGKLLGREVDRKNIKNALSRFIKCYKSIFQKNSYLMMVNVIFHFKKLFNFKSLDGTLEQASLENNELYNFMFNVQEHSGIDRIAWCNHLLSLNIIQNSDNLVLN